MKFICSITLMVFSFFLSGNVSALPSEEELKALFSPEKIAAPNFAYKNILLCRFADGIYHVRWTIESRDDYQRFLINPSLPYRIIQEEHKDKDGRSYFAFNCPSLYGYCPTGLFHILSPIVQITLSPLPQK